MFRVNFFVMYFTNVTFRVLDPTILVIPHQDLCLLKLPFFALVCAFVSLWKSDDNFRCPMFRHPSPYFTRRTVQSSCYRRNVNYGAGGWASETLTTLGWTYMGENVQFPCDDWQLFSFSCLIFCLSIWGLQLFSVDSVFIMLWKKLC
jgi:hypothetical protein